MYQVGRLCYKIAGRDSNRPCVIVDNVDEKTVLIDGAVRRKNVNIIHIEPTEKVLEIAKGADTKTVVEALEKEGFNVPKTGEARETAERAKKQKAGADKVKEAPKTAKKATKKAAKPKATEKVAEKAEAKTESKEE